MLGLAGEQGQTREQEQALLEGETSAFSSRSAVVAALLTLRAAGFEAEQAHLHEWPWLRSRAGAGGVVHLMQSSEAQSDAMPARLLARDPFLLSRFPGLHFAFPLPLLQLILLLLHCVSRGF